MAVNDLTTQEAGVETTADNSGAEKATETTQKALTLDELLASNKELQSQFDRKVTGALSTAKKTWEEDKSKEMAEAAKLAKMNQDEKEKYEKEKLITDIAEHKKKDNARTLKDEAIRIITEKDIPVGYLELIDFTAVDAARTARRLGAKNVYIAYRRTRDEMPATAEEIAEAEAEGVKIMYLVAPTEIVAENGKVSAIKMTTQVLGESDTSGRRRPEAVCGAEFTLKCDTVVAAIGQIPCKCATDGIKTTRSGMIAVNEWNAVDEFIYAGGDAVEVRNIISAVADGRRAAYCIDFKLSDGNPKIEVVNIADTVDPYAVLRRNPYFTDNGAVDLDTKAGAERVKNFDTFRRVMTEDEAVKEASRCLKCGCGEGCQLCKTICTDFAVDIIADDTLQINKDKCVACGMCYNRCPNGNIEMIDLGIKA